MASPKSLITALAAAGFVGALGLAYAQSSDSTQANQTQVQQQQAADMRAQQAQTTGTTSVPPVAAEPRIQDSLPQTTPQPQYNDAPVIAPEERAPRADRN